MKDKDKEFWRNMYQLTTVGINIVVATFLGLGIGLAIDKKLMPMLKIDTFPWFTLIFLLLGIIAGFRNIFLIIREKGDGGGDSGGGEEKK